jgi:hypothetical protein
MFDIFKKKNTKSYLAMQIESKGLDQVTTEVVAGLMRQLSGTGYMYNFILAELDGASMGNEKAKKFAKESGFRESEYKGQHQFEHPLIDGPNGAKTILDMACLGMIDEHDLAVDFRLMTLDKLMRQIEIGKYDNDKEQKAADTPTFINSKGQIVRITGPQIEPNSRSLDGPEFSKNLNQFYNELSELSKRPTQKACQMTIIPCDGSFWSWDFEFSDEEMDLANEIVSKLYDYTQGWIQAPTFPIRKNAG